MTKQRKLILDIIQNSKEHLTADQIFLQAKEISPSIAVGTVYRNLKIMTEEHMIGKISLYNQPDRYDHDCHTHHHLVCQSCGKIIDADFNGLDSFLQNQTDEKILGYDLNVYYCCEECRSKAQTMLPA